MINLGFMSELDGLNFSDSELAHSKKNDYPLLLTVYTKGLCNAKCPSCFISSKDDFYDELTIKQYLELIENAKKIGVKSIKISGAGEPLILKDTLQIIKKCYEIGLKLIIYTNGSTIGDNYSCQHYLEMDSFELIDLLKSYNVSLVYKFNSVGEKIQDYLLGVEGMSRATYRGIFNLLFKEYNVKKKLALQTIITPYNYGELEAIYSFARKNNIIPYFETVLRKEEASSNTNLYVTEEKVKELFLNLADIDAKHYNYLWTPVPSYANFQCTELRYSFVIDNFGYGRVCPGIWIELGNIQNEAILDIWHNKSLESVRQGLNKELNGKCQGCKIRAQGKCSYGCRAYAYLNTGDIFGPYDECWWN